MSPDLDTPANDTLDRLISNNREWVAQMTAENPAFFADLAKGQAPKVLWIGCSDSRVAVDALTNTQPGEVFIHRNIANRIPSEDVNVNSVIDYAVRHLKVEHIVVAGHTSCGGIKAALSTGSVGVINRWLQPIKDIYIDNRAEIDALPKEERADRLSELNVKRGVRTVAHLPVVHEAWREGRHLQIHGWMLELHTGLLTDLNMTIACIEQVDSIYKVH
ncbi:hypothetical protein IWQ56_000981 [Coemansia nantahalensis]|uniref:Uncharacterized protein n=2 Tax=Coemansia TaxID=4863 RepID=A0ACC1KUL6_9FUNG|nr:hypothetical protein IWQ57_004307 [Coemansia nantahalensis]KAJ2773463.1 hypothetical protein IWQ56_000981 [Coemansia nantahalensis]KAJ2795414.1 hypothetical protein H4R21_005121 [Coemansia helicoidea]